MTLGARTKENEALSMVRAMENTALRESIRDQHLTLAYLQALVSDHMLHPLTSWRRTSARIRLSVNPDDRQKVLRSMRRAKLQEATAYLRARSHGLRPTSPYLHEERYDTEDGDFILTRFDITPLGGVQGGVGAVYDAAQQAAYNAEMIVSETSGSIAIRENDEQNDDDIVQMRLVLHTPGGLLLDSNLVQFAELVEGHIKRDGSKDEYAVIATDFVDEDGLYPYHPEERVRRDVTAAMLVTCFPSPCKQQQQPDDQMVVISRFVSMRVSHTNLQLSTQAHCELREVSVRPVTNFMDCLQDILRVPN